MLRIDRIHLPITRRVPPNGVGLAISREIKLYRSQRLVAIELRLASKIDNLMNQLLF